MIIKRVSLSTLHRMRSGTVQMGVRVNVVIDFNEFDYNGHARRPTHYNAELIGAHSGTGTFRAQDLSFPRTNSPYGELSFPRLFVPGTKVPWNESFLERKFPGTFVPGPFRSRELSFPGNESSFSFRGTFVPRNFRSSDSPTILQGIGYERRQL